MRDLLAALYLHATSARHRLAAAVDLALLPLAFAYDLAADVGAAFDKRARCHGVVGAVCEPTACHVYARTSPSVSCCFYCGGAREAHALADDQPALNCERCGVFAPQAGQRVCRDCEATPQVGDRYEHASHPGALFKVVVHDMTAALPYALSDGWACRMFATAAELADPAGPWRRLSDDAPTTPTPCEAYYPSERGYDGNCRNCGRDEEAHAPPAPVEPCARFVSEGDPWNRGCQTCGRYEDEHAPPTPVTHGAAVVHYGTPDAANANTISALACGLWFAPWTDDPARVTCPACRAKLAPEVLASEAECSDGAPDAWAWAKRCPVGGCDSGEGVLADVGVCRQCAGRGGDA